MAPSRWSSAHSPVNFGKSEKGGLGHRPRFRVSMSVEGQDGPIFTPARSRSQGPLSDQVTDDPNPRGQCRSWVDFSRTIDASGTTGIGASDPLPSAPAKVGLLTRQPTFGVGDGDYSLRAPERSGPSCRRTPAADAAGILSLLSNGDGAILDWTAEPRDVLETESPAVPCSPHRATSGKLAPRFASLGRNRCETTRSA